MDSRSSESPPKPLGRFFSENLNAVLAVAGKQRDSGAPGPVTSTRLQAETGVARSTLRALKSLEDDSAANPDLDTLERIAEALGVPPAFLLMRPQDWLALGNALGDIGHYLPAAGKLQQDGLLEARSPVEKVLRESNMHPDRRPIAVGASPEVARANARDEWRRRHCLTLDALMLRQIRTPNPRVALAAIAGAMAVRATPNDPKIEN